MWLRIVCLLALCCCLVASLREDSKDNLRFELARKHQLVERNFLVGIASLGALKENSSQCGQELVKLLEAVDKQDVWSLKVVDYFGAPPSTFIWGNYFWFSNPDLCYDLNQPLNINLAKSQPLVFNETSPFPMRFIVVYLNFTSPYYIDLKLPFETHIHLGLCLPESCKLDRIRYLADLYFQSEKFEMQRQFQLQMQTVGIKAPHFSWQYFKQPGSIVFLIILTLCTALIILAELIHKSRHHLQFQRTIYVKTHQHDAFPPRRTYNNVGCGSSSLEKLLMCFRLADNYQTVKNLENSNRESTFLNVIAGMRSIICLWITVFHVYYYSLFAMSNVPLIFVKLEKLALQPVIQSCFYVDVFFIMSSFLLVFNFLSNSKLQQKLASGSWWENFKMFLISLLRRYMRLTPVMVCTMILTTMVSDFLNMHSPFRLGERSGFQCKTNWWYNLLYIQNLLDMNCICCSWTWYLACEMQYFILFTGLLYSHVKHPKAAKVAFVTLALGFVATAWICNYTNGITFQIDVIYSTLSQLYVAPWVRILPYIGGAAMGWFMHSLQQRQLKQQVTVQMHSSSSCMSAVFWLVCFTVYVATNFMSYWRSTPTWAVATIMSIGKILFALGVGGVIIMCARGRGGYLNSLLSARPFLFLNKFCFSIYMWAPVVVLAMFGLRNEPTNFTEVGSGADFITAVILAIICAFLSLILVELPMQRVSKVLLG